MSLIGGLQGLYAVRNAIEFRDHVRFLVPASIGITIGYLCLELINVILLKLLVASLLIMFGGFFAFRKKLPNLKKRFLLVDTLVGFIGGLSGMMTGMSGVILTMGCSLYAWTKAQRRALVQPFNMIVLGTVLILMGLRGLLAPHIWLIVAIAFPFFDHRDAKWDFCISAVE
jgi:Sulfite exporter TauE/SafE.